MARQVIDDQRFLNIRTRTRAPDTCPGRTITIPDDHRARGSGVSVVESALAPPGPIPNPVVTQRSAGKYYAGDCMGG